MRGAFYMHNTQRRSSRVPALAGVSRDQRQPLPLVILSAAKNLAPPPLKPRCVRWRACLDPPDALAKFFASGELLLATAPKVTKRAAPESAPSHRQRRSAMRGSPALLGRGGVFRQAIPGLSKNASASLPRPRLRAAIPPQPVMLGAARRGGTSKAGEAAAKNEIREKRNVLLLFRSYARIKAVVIDCSKYFRQMPEEII